MWRQRLRGPFAFPTVKFLSYFRRTLFWSLFCCWCRVRHWWAYTLATVVAHFIATQQAHWPVLYALHCEAFDAAQNVLAAAGIRLFIKSPLNRITLRDAVVFVLIAVIIVPFGTAFWGAAFTISNGFGTDYWVEWRNLGISNGVTAVVLVPALSASRQSFVGSRRQSDAGTHDRRKFAGIGNRSRSACMFLPLCRPDRRPRRLYSTRRSHCSSGQRCVSD